MKKNKQYGFNSGVRHSNLNWYQELKILYTRLLYLAKAQFQYLKAEMTNMNEKQTIILRDCWKFCFYCTGWNPRLQLEYSKCAKEMVTWKVILCALSLMILIMIYTLSIKLKQLILQNNFMERYWECKLCYRCMYWTGPKSKEFSEPTGEKSPFWRFWYNYQLLVFLCHKPHKNHLVMELWVQLNYWLQKQFFKDHLTTKGHLTTPKSMLQFFKENISGITSIFIPYCKITLVCHKIEEIPADAKKYSWNAELPLFKTSDQRFARNTKSFRARTIYCNIQILHIMENGVLKTKI